MKLRHRTGRVGHFARETRRAWRALWSAFAGPPKLSDGPSTADWHHVEPSHPSLLCKCHHGQPAGLMADHLPDCAWMALACRKCRGDGTCERCGGDGTEPRAGFINGRDEFGNVLT